MATRLVNALLGDQDLVVRLNVVRSIASRLDNENEDQVSRAAAILSMVIAGSRLESSDDRRLVDAARLCITSLAGHGYWVRKSVLRHLDSAAEATVGPTRHPLLQFAKESVSHRLVGARMMRRF